MTSQTQFIENALSHQDRAMTYMVSRRLAELFPDQTVLQVRYGLDIDGFLRYGQGEARLVQRIANEELAYWEAEGKFAARSLMTSWIEVEWHGSRFQVLRMPMAKCHLTHWVVGPDAMIDTFLVAALGFGQDRAPRTWVYTGWWQDAQRFDRAIEKAAWSDLVLPESTVKTLRENTIEFFESEGEFERMGIPWKRGILMTGPPGNGKTHAIRVLLNQLPVPRLIVKNLGDDADDVQDVFDKVRELAPCVLVLEDIDSLIKPGLLSAVLNSLDGTEPLQGVLVLATTNHPERLDPAIRNRPSRFDRVLEFGPPALAERRRLLRKFLMKAPEEARPTPSEIAGLAKQTDGFSYAYLKELAVSALTVWSRDRGASGVFGYAAAVIGELRDQMTAAVASPEEED